MSACWWWRFCLVHFGRFSEMREKVLSLLDQYTHIIKEKFHASMPSKEKLID